MAKSRYGLLVQDPHVCGEKIDRRRLWIFAFKAFEDNNHNRENELDIGTSLDEKCLDSQMENIKKGGTVEERLPTNSTI